jgi:hypothetical protein
MIGDITIELSDDKKRIVTTLIDDPSISDQDLVIYYQQLLKQNCDSKYLTHPTFLGALDDFSLETINGYESVGITITRLDLFQRCYETAMVVLDSLP